MNDDELGRLLGGAFDAQARADVPGHRPPPPPRFAAADETRPATHRAGRGTRILAPLLAAAAVLVLVAGGVAIADLHGRRGAQAASDRSGRTSMPGAVHIRLLNSDGSQVGVGMPVIAYFSDTIASGAALSRATTVTVNGLLQRAAWYFEPSDADPHYPIEGHLRLQHYWPAHSAVHVAINAENVPAGAGRHFDDSLTLDFRTRAATVATVDAARHMMVVRRDGRLVRRVPVSLGSAATPTRSGIKVIMDKGARICMHGPGYRRCDVPDVQRLTYDGEFLSAAPWNLAGIGHRNTSDGSTNVTPVDAAWLYRTMRIGDVVQYPATDGRPMELGAGYGDWDVSWPAWLTGGLVPTR